MWVSKSYDINTVIRETIQWSDSSNKILYHNVIQDYIYARFPNLFDHQVPLFVTVEKNKIKKIDYINHCTICMEDKNVVWTCLPCKHWFHTHCIKQWIAKNPTCPLCRAAC